MAAAAPALPGARRCLRRPSPNSTRASLVPHDFRCICRLRAAQYFAGTEKDRADMAIEQVGSHVFCDTLLVLLQHGNVSRPHLRRDLERDMHELSQTPVVLTRLQIVP